MDIRKEIKNLSSNIRIVVCREDGTLEIIVNRITEKTKLQVLRWLNLRCLESCFTKVDFIGLT